MGNGSENQLFADAVANFRAGRNADAANRCRRVLQTAPQHVDALRLLAIIALHERRPHDAEQLLQRAISLVPSQAQLHNDLGTALAALGQTERSLTAFRTAWELNANDPAITCNFGIAILNSGAFTDAARVFEDGTRRWPNDSQMHVFLGDAQRGAGQNEAAVESYTRAAHLTPDDAQIHFRLGIAFRGTGRTAEALKSYQRATLLSPQLADAHFNAGNILKSEGRFPEAAEAYARALAIRPDYVDALQNLAIVFQDGGRLDDAEMTFRHLIHLSPDSLSAHIGLGNVLRSKGSFSDAIAIHRHALELHPIAPDASAALATSLQTGGWDEEAAALYQGILENQPDDALSWAKYAACLWNLGRRDEATHATRRALEIRPDFPEARHALGEQLLSCGQFKEGWDEFESRSDLKDASPTWRGLSKTRWRGEDLAGQRLLLHGEQGLGDRIQFARYIPLLVARGAHVILQCDARLSRLFSHGLGLAEFLTERDPLPEFDVHLPLLSIPRVLGTDGTNIPSNVPYLKPPEELISLWQSRIGGDPSRLKIGIAWAGSPKNSRDKERSMQLADLAPVLRYANADFFSLQLGPPRDQLNLPNNTFAITDLSHELSDMADTAAAMMHLDLVLTVDTSIAHLAGALARPTWLMLPYNEEWRWMRDRSDSPWYPTMRLFRQPRRGDWQSVSTEIAGALVSAHRDVDGGSQSAWLDHR